MDFTDSGHDEHPEVCWGEDGDVIVVLLSLVVVVASRKKVSFLVKGAGLVSKGEVVFGQLSDPSCLSSVQLLWFSEILEVLMIHPDFNVYGGAHEVVAPFG